MSEKIGLVDGDKLYELSTDFSDRPEFNVFVGLIKSCRVPIQPVAKADARLKRRIEAAITYFEEKKMPKYLKQNGINLYDYSYANLLRLVLGIPQKPRNVWNSKELGLEGGEEE